MKALPLLALLCLIFPHAFAQDVVNNRFVPAAQSAATTGNLALWQNPAGLAFMGGGESSAAYLYEWSERGNVHHGGAQLAINFFDALTLGGGLKTEAAFSTKAKNERGTRLHGIMSLALKLSKNFAFGFSALKSHHFAGAKTNPWATMWGFQARPSRFFSLGAQYENIHKDLFAAPNITAGFAVRPFKEFITLGFDTKFASLSPAWDGGFHIDPMVSIKASYGGYEAAVSLEIPGIRDGFNKAIFGLSLDINFAHFGFGLMGIANTAGKNYGTGATMRSSTDVWPSITKEDDSYVKLTIDENGRLEQKPASFAAQFFSTEQDPLSVLTLLQRIEQDESIVGLVLNLKGFAFGDGRAQEWRDALLALRAAGKEVVVYLEDPSEHDYFVATAAHKIYMNSNTTLSLSNFKRNLVYFADMLKKVGIKATAVAAGTYKTAPRQWTNARPQKEELEVAENILNDFYNTVLTTVSKDRNLEHKKLKELFDRGELSAQDAKEQGLVDGLFASYDDAVDGLAPEGQALNIFQSYEHQRFKQQGFRDKKRIVVIPIANTIVSGRSAAGFLGYSPATGADDVVEEIENAADDKEVVGIIVRIDSPGGVAEAGHRIHHALAQAKKKKPVVTSMSDVAASAGYLIATGSEHILALPNTITGSIGVFSLMFSAEKLADKLGIFSQKLSPIKNPGPTLFKTVTSSEQKQMQRIVDWHYGNFITTVSDSLSLDKKHVEKVAEGHVWLGKEAQEKKLIHELGGFAQAVKKVKDLANYTEQVTIDIRTPRLSGAFPLSFAIHGFLKTDENLSLSKALSPVLKSYGQALQIHELNGKPLARLPFMLEPL